MNLHMKSSKVSIKTRSTPASLSFKGQATRHTTVKWSIHNEIPDTHYVHVTKCPLDPKNEHIAKQTVLNKIREL